MEETVLARGNGDSRLKRSSAGGEPRDWPLAGGLSFRTSVDDRTRDRWLAPVNINAFEIRFQRTYSIDKRQISGLRPQRRDSAVPNRRVESGGER